MKKTILFAIFLLIFVYACQPKTDAMQKPETQAQQPATETAGDSAADSFGNDMGNTNNEDEELSSSELEGIDSGFSDIENI